MTFIHYEISCTNDTIFRTDCKQVGLHSAWIERMSSFGRVSVTYMKVNLGLGFGRAKWSSGRAGYSSTVSKVQISSVLCEWQAFPSQDGITWRRQRTGKSYRLTEHRYHGQTNMKEFGFCFEIRHSELAPWLKLRSHLSSRTILNEAVKHKSLSSCRERISCPLHCVHCTGLAGRAGIVLRSDSCKAFFVKSVAITCM